MRGFARRFGVDLSEAERPIEGYATFAEFFTRRLKPGLRPIDPGERVVVSPVDGKVSQAGAISKNECIQAKGICYPVDRLLDSEADARDYDDGVFATLYLSPRDYHRIHAPVAGRVVGYTYVPGELWPVNPASVRSKQALFCLNERLVTHFETAFGKMALVAVGATAVSRIRAGYDAFVTRNGQKRRRHRYEKPIALKKGDEVGMFEMGSTVVLLFQKGRVAWDASLVEGAVLRMGRRIGEAT